MKNTNIAFFVESDLFDRLLLPGLPCHHFDRSTVGTLAAHFLTNTDKCQLKTVGVTRKQFKADSVKFSEMPEDSCDALYNLAHNYFTRLVLMTQ